MSRGCYRMGRVRVPGIRFLRMAMMRWLTRWWHFGYQPRHRSTRRAAADAQWLEPAWEPADESGQLAFMMKDADPMWSPAWGVQASEEPVVDERMQVTHSQLTAIRGLAWRRNTEIAVNWDRPFIRNLDDLPIPAHHMLPFDKYRIPMIKGPYTFIVTSRGCTAGCSARRSGRRSIPGADGAGSAGDSIGTRLRRH